MKAGFTKPGHKYISKKKVKGEWQYKYKEGKKVVVKKEKPKKVGVKKKVEKKVVVEKKSRIENYYGKDQHRYFKDEKAKKDFLKRQKAGKAGGKGQKIVSVQRIKVGSFVKVNIRGENYSGRVIGTDGTKSRAPEHFDVEYTDKGKIYIKKGVPKDLVIRKRKSWLQQQKEKKADKKLELQAESRAMNIRVIPDNIKVEAQKLVEANWDKFEKMAGFYYNRRVKGGWDASKFGFTQEDLKMETAVIVMKAAKSYLTNKPKDRRSTFASYVRSFLKADMASALAAGSGAGGHLKASQKNQMYLWFYKDALDEYQEKRKGKYPSDSEMVEILEKKRKKLSNEKGKRTFIEYKWTPEKVRNAKRQTKKMVSLDRVIETSKGDAATIYSIMNEEDIETFGHYRLDPWQETAKVAVREGVEDSIKRVFKDSLDRQILIRKFGLFIDEESPASIRRYAQGWTSGEVADYLTKAEKRRGSTKLWRASDVDKREMKLLEKLGKDKRVERELKDFVKSEVKRNKEWSDASNIMYWITVYKIIEELMNNFFPYYLPVEEEGDVIDIGGEIKEYVVGIKKR